MNVIEPYPSTYKKLLSWYKELERKHGALVTAYSDLANSRSILLEEIAKLKELK